MEFGEHRGVAAPRWWRAVPAWALDSAIAAAVAIVVCGAISVATEQGSRPADVLAYGIGVAIGGVLLARRRSPLLVLGASFVLVMLYHSLNYPAFGPSIGLAAAVYVATSAGHLRAAIAAVALVAGGGTLYRLLLEPGTEALFPLLADSVRETSLLVAVLGLGEAVRSRRAWAAEVADRLGRVEADREREAQRRVTQERLRIARELHDVMAHTVTVIAVQAGVAGEVLDDTPEQARDALRTIRDASREAMADLKATVGVLRDGGSGGSGPDGAVPLAPAPTLRQLDDLVALARASGLQVDVAVSGERRPLPAAVDATAYRIVQESLTNVIRHADASAARIWIGYEPDGVVVEVVDDGRGPSHSGDPCEVGHGLAGMRERALALGGWLRTGARAGGGFRVCARLPVETVVAS